MNKVVFAGLAVSTAMSLAAQAEPLTLSGDQLDKVTASGVGFVDFDVFFDKFKNVNINEFVNVNKTVNSSVFTFGTLAMAEGDANCSHGFFGCVAETLTAADSHFFTPEGATAGFWVATSHSQSLAGTSSPGDIIVNGANGNNGDNGG
jgi:hypothetical protein